MRPLAAILAAAALAAPAAAAKPPAPAPTLGAARTTVWQLRKVAFRYFSEHSSFSGMSTGELRRYNAVLPRRLQVPQSLRVAWADQFSFCIELPARSAAASLAFDARRTRYTLRSSACPEP